MKIGSIAIALSAEYGEFCPSAISLTGSSCTKSSPAAVSQRREARQIGDLADPPALARRNREERHEAPAWRPGGEALDVSHRARSMHPAARPSRNVEGSGSRLTTRNASWGKSKKNPGWTTTPSRSSSVEDERLLRSRVAGTRTTADHPPSAGSTSTAGCGAARRSGSVS